MQSRPITALPLPEAAPPSDWSVPDPTAMYVRASIVEQLPDPLTPLFADLVDGSVTRSLQALFTELTGEGVVRDTDVNLPTLNGYAYYRYSRARHGPADAAQPQGVQVPAFRWRARCAGPLAGLRPSPLPADARLLD